MFSYVILLEVDLEHFLSFLLPNSKSLLSHAVTITKRRTFKLSKILKYYKSSWHSLARHLVLDSSRRIHAVSLSRLASSSFLFSIATQYAWQFIGLRAQQIHWNSMACPMARLVKESRPCRASRAASAEWFEPFLKASSRRQDTSRSLDQYSSLRLRHEKLNHIFHLFGHLELSKHV